MLRREYMLDCHWSAAVPWTCTSSMLGTDHSNALILGNKDLNLKNIDNRQKSSHCHFPLATEY